MTGGAGSGSFGSASSALGNVTPLVNQISPNWSLNAPSSTVQGSDRGPSFFSDQNLPFSFGVWTPEWESAYTGAGTGGSMMESAAQSDMSQGGNLVNYGNTVMNTAFDPQLDLYNRTFAQNMQQVNAAQANSGVGTTPYGAGVTNDAITNFNLNWQNQQLARQLAGLSGAGQAITQGQQLENLSGPLYAAGARMPYDIQLQREQQRVAGATEQLQYGLGLIQPQVQDFTSLGQAFTQLGSAQATAQAQQMQELMQLAQLGMGGLSMLGGMGGGGGMGLGSFG